MRYHYISPDWQNLEWWVIPSVSEDSRNKKMIALTVTAKAFLYLNQDNEKR